MIDPISLGFAAFSLGSSLFGAKENSKAAQKSLESQAKIDTAQRAASANAMIASTQSQNAKADQYKRSMEIMEIQGKADGVMRKEAYNELAAMQMVMGAASGRVVDAQGSLGAIMDKSHEDYMWDQMWNENQVTISKAALQADVVNIYQAGATSLMLGAEQIGIDRQISEAGQANTERQAQITFDNSMRQGISSFGRAYGGGGISNLLGVSG